MDSDGSRERREWETVDAHDEENAPDVFGSSEENLEKEKPGGNGVVYNIW